MEKKIIYQTIASVLSLNESFVTPEKDLVNDLGACLTDIYDIFISLEETFQISVDPEKIVRVRTAGDVEKFFLPGE